MAFHLIDMKTWPRREHYRYYSEKIRTSYQLNVELDVTELVRLCRKTGRRFYPAMIYAIMGAVNGTWEGSEAFRMALDPEGRLGYYDVCHPSYTIFHEDDKTFSDIWTAYDPDFERFYEAATADMDTYKNVKGIKAKPGRPDAYTPVSCVPWIHFSGIAHDTPGPGTMYFPVITFGRYDADGTKYLLPISLFVNHAVADGYHSSMLMREIQDLCSGCGAWMK